MKPKQPVSKKHIAVSQNNKHITLATVAAVSLFVFMLVGGHAMLNRMSYQRRVTSKQSQAIKQLQADQQALNALVNQYKVFSNANPNMLGVSNSGTSGDQGSNARIALDALPSQYDFPALTSSIEKILTGRGVVPQGITGADNGTTTSPNQASQNPSPQPMQFTFTVAGNYQTIQTLLDDFQRSIRPFKVVTIDFTGANTALTVNTTMETYYQPSKTLSIKDMVVK